MRITDVQTKVIPRTQRTPLRIALGGDTAPPAIIVRISTESGLYGFGEASPFAPVTGTGVEGTIGFLEAIRPRLIGQDAFAIEAIQEMMCEVAGALSGGVPVATAGEAPGRAPTSVAGEAPGRAAIDIALHDLVAKRAGLPLYRLLGASTNTVQSDMTIGIDEPAVMAARARQAVEQGFKILKIKVGIDAHRDLEAIRLIRDAVGVGISLRLDANQGWTVEETLRTMRAMERYQVDEIEQPLPADDLDGLRYVRSRISSELMLDESVHSPADALRVIHAQAADIINIKLMKTGGLHYARDVNAIAQAAGIPAMIGCMSEGRIGIAAAAAFAAATGNVRYVDLDSHLNMGEVEGMSGGFTQDGPFLYLSEKPGLGIEVELDFT